MGFSVDISAIFDHTPKSLLEAVSRRARIRRLALGLTQHELSQKAGVSLDVVKRLESSGRISLERLARIAIALDASEPFMTLFPEPAARSIDELEAHAIGRARVYGKRRDAGISRGPRSRAVPSSSDDESSR